VKQKPVPAPLFHHLFFNSFKVPECQLESMDFFRFCLFFWFCRHGRRVSAERQFFAGLDFALPHRKGPLFSSYWFPKGWSTVAMWLDGHVVSQVSRLPGTDGSRRDGGGTAQSLQDAGDTEG
jgi:hypothetical protein